MNPLLKKTMLAAEELAIHGYSLNLHFEDYEKQLNLPYHAKLDAFFKSTFREAEFFLANHTFDRYFRADLFEFEKYQPFSEKILNSIFFLYFKGKPLSSKFKTKKQKIALAKAISESYGWMFLKVAIDLSLERDDENNVLFLAEFYRKKAKEPLDIYPIFRKKLDFIGSRYTY